MTTIAWDGRYLAGDGLVMTGGDEPLVLQREFQKIHVNECLVEDGWWRKKIQMRAYAGAGCLGSLREFGEHFISGLEGRPENRDSDKDEDFHCLTLQADVEYGGALGPLTVTEWDESPYTHDVPSYFALGVGKKYCMAVMEHGGTALEAMRIAAKLDPWTGGRLSFLDVENWRRGVVYLD